MTEQRLTQCDSGLTVLRDVAGAADVLTPEALDFVAALEAEFAMRRHALLLARGRRTERVRGGAKLGFDPETEGVRRGIWRADPSPIIDRRVELIAPANDLGAALESGAPIIIADFEDTASPGFARMIAGQAALRAHRVGPVLMMRPRALHSAEENVIAGGAPISAAFFDLGLHLFHNGRELAEAGRGPFCYLPKIDGAGEARFWRDVLGWAEARLDLAPGSIKVTAMVETLTAAFEMDEMIEALGPHIIAMSFGSDDLIVDYLSKFEADGAHLLPDADQIAPDAAFLASIAARLVKVCHRRGIHAIGGMHAGAEGADAGALRAQMARVIGDGHDGAWVMDPGQLAAAQQVWHDSLPEPNQIRTPRQHYRIDAEALLRPHEGPRSEAGLRAGIARVMAYLSAWLQGRGTCIVDGQVIDMAAAEIARHQLRQWLRLGTPLEGEVGEIRLTEESFGQYVQAHIQMLLDEAGPGGFHRGHYASAARILIQSVTTDLPHLAEAAGPVLQALDH